MKQHTCELCHTIFNRKEHLIQHSNKLRKCNIATEFECEWCNKSFTVNSSLIRHINKCKVKCKQDELASKIQEEAQLTNDRVEELEAKYKILEDKVNAPATPVPPLSTETNTASISGSSNTNAPTHHSHNPITTNSHNTTNNITINIHFSQKCIKRRIKLFHTIFHFKSCSWIEEKQNKEKQKEEKQNKQRKKDLNPYYNPITNHHPSFQNDTHFQADYYHHMPYLARDNR